MIFSKITGSLLGAGHWQCYEAAVASHLGYQQHRSTMGKLFLIGGAFALQPTRFANLADLRVLRETFVHLWLKIGSTGNYLQSPVSVPRLTA